MSGFIPLSLKRISWTNTLIIIASFLFILLAIYYYYYFLKPTFSPTYKHNLEGVSNMNNNKEAEIMLFSVEWCPHCKSAKPEWQQVKAEFDGKTINGYNVVFTEINCTDENAEIEKMINTYNYKTITATLISII